MAFWRQQTLLVDVQSSPHMAGVFVEEWTLRARSITLPVIESPCESLAFSFGSFWLFGHAFYFFGIILPLLLRIATAAEAEQKQQNDRESVHVPSEVHCFSLLLLAKSLTAQKGLSVLLAFLLRLAPDLWSTRLLCADFIAEGKGDINYSHKEGTATVVPPVCSGALYR